MLLPQLLRTPRLSVPSCCTIALMTHAQHHSHAQRPVNDPGLSYGIVGIVMLVIGLPFIGIFVSIFGYRKSKKAGYHNTLAQIGIWLNAIFIVVIGLIIAGVIALFRYGATVIDKELQQARSSATAAAQIEKLIKGKVDGGVYPDYETILREYAGSELVSNKPGPGQVGYQECRTSTGEISGIKLYFSDTSSTDLKDWETYVSNEQKIIGICAEGSSIN